MKRRRWRKREKTFGESSERLMVDRWVSTLISAALLITLADWVWPSLRSEPGRAPIIRVLVASSHAGDVWQRMVVAKTTQAS